MPMLTVTLTEAPAGVLITMASTAARKPVSLSEIAKRAGQSRNTVKKWLRAPGEAVPKYERVSAPGKLTAF